MKITLNPDHAAFGRFVASVPSLFVEGAGILLYSGRNEVRLLERDGMRIVAKRFRRHDILKRIIYTFFRESKARRAYNNAAALRALGFDTPAEIAFIEDVRGGFVRQAYYVCEYTDMQAVRGQLEAKPYNSGFISCYARFVASLHDRGVLHRDLNSTNVLYRENADGYSFQLIDINRMTFYDNMPVPKAERMENLTLMWGFSDVYMAMLGEYAAACGWTDEDVARAVFVKKRHDRRWTRRKRFTRALKTVLGIKKA